MFEYKEYKLTWEPIEVDSIPESLQDALEDIFWEAQNPRKNTITKIKRLIKKYPQNLQLRNYLSATYNALGYKDKAMEINNQLIDEYPDYFFARVNKAYHHEANEEYEEMEELMGKGFDLKTLYPDRNVFHVAEFMSMQMIALSYYIGTGDLEQAELRLEMMEEVDPDSESIELAYKKLMLGRFKMASKRYEEEKKTRITPRNTFSPEQVPDEDPEFNFIETHQLYLPDFGEDIEAVRHYLSLDRNKLIEDLEKALKYDYALFSDCDDKDGFGVGFHTYNLLGELEASESLPVIFEMMRMNENYRECTFGDFLTQDGWVSLMRMTKDNPGALEDYLKLPGADTYFRSVATDVLKQIYLHYPEKQAEVKAIYQQLLQYFIDATIEDEVIDTELNGFIVWDLIDLRLSEYLPLIEQLYESDKVNPGICGDFESVEQDIKTGEIDSQTKKNVESIYDLYGYYFSEESPVIDMEKVFREAFESKSKSFPNPKPIGTIISEKIERNAPCPCGSGKKFKKCCMGKGIFD